MVIGLMENGKKCIYDLPKGIINAKQFNSLIYGHNRNPRQREELQGQPLLLGLNGPMYNGTKRLSTGEIVIVIRYEEPCKY